MVFDEEIEKINDLINRKQDIMEDVIDKLEVEEIVGERSHIENHDLLSLLEIIWVQLDQMVKTLESYKGYLNLIKEGLETVFFGLKIEPNKVLEDFDYNLTDFMNRYTPRINELNRLRNSLLQHDRETLDSLLPQLNNLQFRDEIEIIRGLIARAPTELPVRPIQPRMRLRPTTQFPPTTISRRGRQPYQNVPKIDLLKKPPGPSLRERITFGRGPPIPPPAPPVSPPSPEELRRRIRIPEPDVYKKQLEYDIAQKTAELRRGENEKVIEGYKSLFLRIWIPAFGNRNSEDSIRHEYRRYVHEYHPDSGQVPSSVKPQANELFSTINRIYPLLVKIIKNEKLSPSDINNEMIPLLTDQKLMERVLILIQQINKEKARIARETEEAKIREVSQQPVTSGYTRETFLAQFRNELRSFYLNAVPVVRAIETINQEVDSAQTSQDMERILQRFERLKVAYRNLQAYWATIMVRRAGPL